MKKITLLLLLLPFIATAQPYKNYAEGFVEDVKPLTPKERALSFTYARDLLIPTFDTDSITLSAKIKAIEEGIAGQLAEIAELKNQLDSLSYFKSLVWSVPDPIVTPEPIDTVITPPLTGEYVTVVGRGVTANDCTPWKRIRTGTIENVELENNVWGTNGDSRYKSCLIVNPDGSFGWTWSTPSNLNNNVKMYLQAVVGHKPFFHYTLGKGFPFTMNELDGFSTHFKAETNASGKYNLAYEFWTVKEYHSDNEYINKTRAGGNNITGEYMFWMQAHFGMPVSHRNQVIDGRTWNVTVGGDNQLYVAFIPADGLDITEATINFMPFLEWLRVHGLIDPNEKIVSLELGNEIIEGSGETIIKDYSVSVTKK